MRAVATKEFRQFSPSEQKRLIGACNRAATAEMYNRLDAEVIRAQTVWIRMAIINLHQCGISKDKILEFLGTWKSIYRTNARMKSETDQAAWLDRKMTEILGGSGFVTEYIESLKKI
mgnify:CR=1 FL=1